MSEINYENRFAVSLLSKEKYDTAYNQEVLIDKNTGEILVKTDNGDVVSFDRSTRREVALTKLFHRANELGIYGDIYECPTVTKIINDIPKTIPLPAVVEQMTELRYTIKNPEKKIIERVLVYFDADLFVLNEDGITSTVIKPAFEIDITGATTIAVPYPDIISLEPSAYDELNISCSGMVGPIGSENLDIDYTTATQRIVVYNVFILVETN